MKRFRKWLPLPIIALLCLALGTAAGSTGISLSDIIATLSNKLMGKALPEHINPRVVSVVWLRLRQACMAFAVGASLSLSGTVMQSILRNPLASSYTLGVSSGASLFAALVIVTGFNLPIIEAFTLPLAGFLGGLLTVAAAIFMTMYFDRSFENQTIILVGMVLSLFVNALLTLVTALSSDHLARLVFWQMGSFSGRTWTNVWVQSIVLLVCLLVLINLAPEMDLLTFGDEQAQSAGVNVKNTKLLFIVLASFLTGTSVSMVGIIGFVDLIAPHVARRIYGAKHQAVLPASAFIGGSLMIIADLFSRVLMAGRALPVGAVTALIGAPFFTWVFFHGARRTQ